MVVIATTVDEHIALPAHSHFVMYAKHLSCPDNFFLNLIRETKPVDAVVIGKGAMMSVIALYNSSSFQAIEEPVNRMSEDKNIASLMALYCTDFRTSLRTIVDAPTWDEPLMGSIFDEEDFEKKDRYCKALVAAGGHGEYWPLV